MAGQRRLCDVDGAVHHLETAQPGHRLPSSTTSMSSSALAVSCAGRQRRRGWIEQCGGAAPHSAQPFRRGPRLGLGRLVAAAGLAAREADRDGEVGVDRGDRRHRQRVEDAAVGEQPPVEHVRCDHAGDRDRRPDGRVDRTTLQPNRFARRAGRWKQRCRGSAALRSSTSPRMSRTASRIFSARSTPAAVMDGSSSRSTARCVKDLAQSANSSSLSAACRPPTSAPIDDPAMPTMS